MKNLNPTVVISVAVVAVLVAGVMIWRTMAPASAPQQTGMPSTVAAEFGRRMGGATAPGTTAPPSGRAATAVPGMPGGYVPPPGTPTPNGTPGGYIQPPTGR